MPSSATAQRDAARGHTHRAYAERNELLALLARLWPAHLMPAVGALEPLDRRAVLCIHPPGSDPLAYVLDESESAPFEHLSWIEPSHWDGCTRAQRSERIAALPGEARATTQKKPKKKTSRAKKPTTR